jgi:hypothetical protein
MRDELMRKERERERERERRRSKRRVCGMIAFVLRFCSDRA